MTKPLEALRTGDGRELPPLLKAEIRRELDRLALATTQLAAVERARDALIRTQAEERNNPAAQLLKLKGLGPEFASLLWLEFAIPQLRQPPPGGGLRRIGPQPLAERRRRTGSGHLQVGQPPPAQDHDRAGFREAIRHLARAVWRARRSPSPDFGTVRRHEVVLVEAAGGGASMRLGVLLPGLHGWTAQLEEFAHKGVTRRDTQAVTAIVRTMADIGEKYAEARRDSMFLMPDFTAGMPIGVSDIANVLNPIYESIKRICEDAAKQSNEASSRVACHARPHGGTRDDAWFTPQSWATHRAPCSRPGLLCRAVCEGRPACWHGRCVAGGHRGNEEGLCQDIR